MTQTPLLTSPIGLGFRPVHYNEVLEEKPKLGWFEVVSENFVNLGGRPRYFLESLRSLYPVACHGVGMSIGSTDPLDMRYLKKLKELINVCEPFLVTDHLCWTSHKGHNSHDLLPLPYTEECLKHISDRVSRVQDFLGRHILLENPSAYISFAHSTMSEGEFLSELSKRSGCRLLLDVNNLFVNSCNLGVDPLQYMETLTLDAVEQFHLSGHSVSPEVRIDTHDHEIDPKVWDLFVLAANRWPKAPALIEWDDHIPELKALMGTAKQAADLHKKAMTLTDNERSALLISVTNKEVRGARKKAGAPNLVTLQDQFHGAITKLHSNDKADESVIENLLDRAVPVKASIGLGVYANAYYLRIKEVFQDLFEGFVFLIDEEAGLDTLLIDYLKKHPPASFNINDIGARFPSYLEEKDVPADFGVEIDLVSDIARLEWLKIESFESPDHTVFKAEDLGQVAPEEWPQARFILHPSVRFFTSRCEANTTLTKLTNKELPEPPVRETHHYLVYRQTYGVDVLELTPAEMSAVKAIHAHSPFEEVTSCFKDKSAGLSDEAAEEAALQQAVPFLVKLCNLHAISTCEKSVG